jgi:hypothetical protein
MQKLISNIVVDFFNDAASDFVFDYYSDTKEREEYEY